LAPALAGIAAIPALLFLLLLLKRKKEEPEEGEIPTDVDAEDGGELTEKDLMIMTGDDIFISEYGLSDEIPSGISEELLKQPAPDPDEFEGDFVAVSEYRFSDENLSGVSYEFSDQPASDSGEFSSNFLAISEYGLSDADGLTEKGDFEFARPDLGDNE
jgi:hypothetical protein